jgi:inhibitor of KinA sporulation pathway (predicted exonuclease)
MGPPPPGMFNEIIEIGLAVVDYKTKIISSSHSIIIKPEFSEVSKFCTELTTLTQEYLDEHGISFKEACRILREEYLSDKRLFFSWGDYDRTAFELNCKKLNVPYPFGKTHFNLKALHAFHMNRSIELGVSNALKDMNLEFEGTQHRGIDDAINISRILGAMYSALEEQKLKEEN